MRWAPNDEPSWQEVARAELELVDRSTDATSPCVVVGAVMDERSVLLLVGDNTNPVSAAGDDFEEALVDLRAQLEKLDLVLLCNRFRTNALVTSQSRQMSDGLACYLVQPRTPVDPDQLVDCLGPAEASTVGSQDASDEYITRWTQDRPIWSRWRRKRGR